LAALAGALRAKFRELNVNVEIANTALECVELEADGLRLALDAGYPWDTISTELKVMRVFHSEASVWQHAFSLARLAPALVLPSDMYYRWRQRVSNLTIYKSLRERFFPFPVQSHVERSQQTKT
jgi:hypothetical protein